MKAAGSTRSIPWTFAVVGGLPVLVVPALSVEAPASCSLGWLKESVRDTNGTECRAVLSLVQPDGARRRFLLEEGHPDAYRVLMATGAVPVLEEDASAPDGIRFAHLATITGMGEMEAHRFGVPTERGGRLLATISEIHVAGGPGRRFKATCLTPGGKEIFLTSPVAFLASSGDEISLVSPPATRDNGRGLPEEVRFEVVEHYIGTLAVTPITSFLPSTTALRQDSALGEWALLRTRAKPPAERLRWSFGYIRGFCPAVLFDAVSVTKPVSATLDMPARDAPAEMPPLLLLGYADGSERLLPLFRSKAEAALRGLSSVLVVEEDSLATDGCRFSYTANVLGSG